MDQLPKTQTAILLKEVGQPLIQGTEPVLQPSEGEALIKISATSLVPLDFKFRDLGVLNIATVLPAVLGLELSGTVLSYGPGAVDESWPPVGSRVFCQNYPGRPMSGGLKEYALSKGELLIQVPGGVGLQQAAMMALNPFTAGAAVFDKEAGFGIPFPDSEEAASCDFSSSKIVVLAAGTSVGKFVVQLARIAGVKTIVTVSSPASFDELRSYGATHLIDRNTEKPADAIKAIVGDDLQHVVDCYSIYSLELAGAIMGHKGGKIVSLLSAGTRLKEEEATELKEKNIVVTGIHGAYTFYPELYANWRKGFPQWLAEGKIVAPSYKVVEGLHADKVNAALDAIRDQASGVKYVVQVE